MSGENKDRKCISCDKKLLDEKLPICLRCRLKGRNTTVKVVEVVGTMIVAVGGANAIKNNSGDGSSTQ